jgi:hypothetical protein
MFIDSRMSHAYSILNSSSSPTSGSTCPSFTCVRVLRFPQQWLRRSVFPSKWCHVVLVKTYKYFREICNIHPPWWWRQQVTMKWWYIYIPDHMTSHPVKTVTLTLIYILFKSYIKMSSIGYLVFFISQIFTSESQRRIVMCYCFQHC